jgi:hypothetical protein
MFCEKGSQRMRVFIVHAHPEPMSFSGAMTRTATTALAHNPDF